MTNHLENLREILALARDAANINSHTGNVDERQAWEGMRDEMNKALKVATHLQNYQPSK